MLEAQPAKNACLSSGPRSPRIAEQGVDEIIESPEKPVHGEVSREHARGRYEDPHRAADPGAHCVGGRSEQQRQALQLQRHVWMFADCFKPLLHRFKPSAV